MLRALLLIVALAFAQGEPTPVALRVQPITPENAARMDALSAAPRVTAFAWSPSGSVLSIAHAYGVSIIDFGTRHFAFQIVDDDASIPTLLFDPRDPTRLLVGRYGETQVIDIASGEVVETLVHPDEVLMAAGDPVFATAHGYGWALLRDMETPNPIARFNPLTDVDLTIHQIALSPDLLRIALATSDGVWMWDVRDGEHDRNDALLSGGYGAGEHSVAFSPNGWLLAAGGGVSADTISTLRLWVLGDDGSITPLDAPPAPTWEHPTTGETSPIQTIGVAFDPRSDLLAAAGEDGRIRLYDAPPLSAPLDYYPLVTLTAGDPNWDTSVTIPMAFNADGTLLAALEPDGDLWVFGVRQES